MPLGYPINRGPGNRGTGLALAPIKISCIGWPASHCGGAAGTAGPAMLAALITDDLGHSWRLAW